MELRSRPKENSDRNKHKVKVIWRSFFGFRRTKGKLNVGLGRKLFLCCSSTVFILISETHVCHVCPPKWWSLSSTTLVSTAESVHCHGRKGMETVGPQWEACGKGRCLLTSLRFMLLLVTRPEENSSPDREFWQYEVKERHWTFDSCYKARWDRTESAPGTNGAALNSVGKSNTDQETAPMFTFWDTACSLRLKERGTMQPVFICPTQSSKPWPSIV